MKSSHWITALALLVLTGCGISGNRYHDPGYADYQLSGWSESDRVVSISLGPAILRFASWGMDESEEGDFQELFKDLRAVRIAVYEMQSDTNRLKKRHKETTSKLVADGWEVLVKTHNEDEDLLVMTRHKGHNITGLVVLVLESEELVFINLMGNIDPQHLGGLLRGIDDSVDVDIEVSLPEDLSDSV